MRRFVEGVDRSQTTLFPESLDDWIDENNPVRVIDAFVDALDLRALGFGGVVPEATGRPSYHPAILLKLYIYGYLNRVQSSRRLEREASRNVELMWLTGRLAPDHKTIANFRKDSGRAIRQVCAQFITLCRRLGLLNTASVAIDGSKFKAVNTGDRLSWARRTWRLWLTGAPTRARISWPARELASRLMCLRPSTQAPRLTDALASRTLSIIPRTTPIAVPLESA